MRMINLVAALVLGLSLSSTVSAQCLTPVTPGLETFDSLTPSATTPAFGTLNASPLPTGWTRNITTALNSWAVWTGPSPSYSGNTPNGQTGPPGDHTSGTGIYLFTESSSAVSGGEAILEVCYDLTTLANPFLSFWYHMNGSTQGSLKVEQSLDGGLTWPILIFSDFGDHGNVWLPADDLPLTPDLNGQAHLRIVGVMGASWRGDTAIDDVAVTNRIFETNDADGAVTFDGQTGTTTAPLIINMNSTPCGGNSGVLRVETDNATALHEVVLSDGNLVPLALAFGNNEILNLSLFSNLSGLNGGGPIALAPMPGAFFPAAGHVAYDITVTPTGTLDVSVQSVFTIPTTPPGFVLSAPVEIHAAAGTIAPFTAFPAGTSDDAVVVIDVTAPATCLSSAGFVFGGTAYNNISLATNGRIGFGVMVPVWDPTLTKALTGPPMFGFWSDLTPSPSSTVSSPAPGVLQLDFVTSYFGTTIGATYSLKIDDPNQEYTMDGLQGIATNPGSGPGDVQFLGISLGGVGGATDPGATTFSAGTVGTTVVGTDMLYDLYDPSALGTTPGLGLSLLPGVLNKVVFAAFPGGFVWTGS